MAPKKEKAQKMQLGEFLTDPSLGSWADEMEDVPLPAVPASRSAYGSGGDRGYGNSSGFSSTSRYEDRGYSVREELPLPTRPPFTVHLGNLSFDATEGDLQGFFQDCEVDNIRIVEDKLDMKPKGFGYVEFKTIDGLKKALTLGGEQFQGRNIRISVAEPQKDRQGQDASRDFSDWSRKGPLPEAPQRRATDRATFGTGAPRGPLPDTGSESGGQDRGNRRDYAGASDGKVRDFGNWDRKGPLTPAAPSGPQSTGRLGDRPTSRDGSTNMRRGSPAWGEGRPQDGTSDKPPRREFTERPVVERQPTAAEQDSQWRARMKPDVTPAPPTPTASQSPAVSTQGISTPPSPAGPPTSRPKLNLAKRTIPEAPEAAATSAAPASDSKASPFGAARPIDTAAREKEVEEKRIQSLKEKKEADDKAREERKIADEKAKEEKKGKDGEATANKSAGKFDQTSGPRASSTQQQGGPGDRRNLPRRDKPAGDANKPRPAHRSGEPSPRGQAPREQKEGGSAPAGNNGRSYEILRRQDEDGENGNEAAETNAQSKAVDAAIAASGDKDTKPQDIVRDPTVTEGKTDEGPALTSEKLEDDGWSTVSKPERKRKNNTGGQHQHHSQHHHNSNHSSNAASRAIAS